MATFNLIRSVATRSQSTLAQDTAGAAALVVMLLVGLYLPGFF